jgi:transposase
VGVKSAAAST